MSVRTLLIGPGGAGGEGAYMRLMRSHPPDDIVYTTVGGFHEGGRGVGCDVGREVGLNRLVRRRAIPDMGFRALRLRDRFDLVHVHAHPIHLARLDGTPVVMSEGSSSAVYLGDYLGWDENQISRAFRRSRRIYRALGIRDRLLATDRVVRVYVFSEWARDVNLRWGADPEKLDVVPPGFPTPDEVQREHRDTFSLLFVGTDFERKGGFDVVEAFDRVTERHAHARLVIAGSDPWTPNPERAIYGWVGGTRRARVLSRLEELERGGLARVHGPLSSTIVRNDLYPAADAFVMPTLAEGFGFTNVEAMSYALPVISSRVGPIPDVITDEKTGLLVEPGDVDGLVEAMDHLVSDPERAGRMGAAARSEFLGRYTLDHFRSRLGGVYRRALGAA